MEVFDSVSIQPSDSFQILDELDRTEFYSAFNAIHVPTTTKVRLTRLTAGISASPEFRAAFRKDEASLRALEHTNVLPLLFWGEDKGRLFFATQRPDGESLSKRLDQGLQLLWDEFTDLGWQIASAIQHTHNRGITHGRLTPDSVMISDELLVEVLGFGLYHWIAEASAAPRSPPTFHELVQADVSNFGHLLATLLNAVKQDSEPPADAKQLAEIHNLINTLKEPDHALTARDVQGRLGDILLKVAGDSIEMIDDREGQGLSRRSIVDELFDETDKANVVAHATARRPGNRIRFWTITVLCIVVALAYLLYASS